MSISDLRIRKGPGTNYGSRGFTGKGVFTIVAEATGKGASKWGLLKSYANKRDGWISLDYNPTKQMFAIQACGMDAEGANRVPKKNQDDRYEIKSKNLVRLIYQSCGWDRTRSYRLPGVEYPQQRLVNYDLCRAIPIFEGKVDKENESAQEATQAVSGAENIRL